MNKPCGNRSQESMVTRSLWSSARRSFKRLAACLKGEWEYRGKRVGLDDYEGKQESSGTASGRPYDPLQEQTAEPEQEQMYEGTGAKRARVPLAYFLLPDRKWLKHNCDNAIGIIKRARHSEQEFEADVQGCENVYVAVETIYKQMLIRFDVMKLVSYADQSKIKEGEKCFEAIRNNLYFLCLSQQANSLQYHFCEISYFSKKMEARLRAVYTTLQQWSDHWQGSLFRSDLTIIQQKIEKTIRASCEVVEISSKAARSCDVKDLRKSNKSIGRWLTRLYSDYYEATCLLNQLKCVEMECGFFSQVNSRLDRAGHFVAEVLRVQMAITISKEDKYSIIQLTSSWSQQNTYILEAEEAIKQWQQRQICAPTYDCVETFGYMRDCVSEALKSAAVLEADSTNREALRNQREVVDRFEAKVVELSAKAGEFKGIRRRVFDKFFWELVKIRLVLRRGGAGKGALPQTAAPLKKIFAAWKTLEKTAAGGKPMDADELKRAAWELSKGARSWLRQLTGGTSTPPPATLQLPQASQAFAQPSSQAMVRCSPTNVRAVWQQTQKLLSGIKVADGMEESKQEMIARIQQQESWLTTYALPGKVAVERVAEHSYAQWTGVFSALTVIASCAKDAAESKRCAAQLAEQDSIMNRALGVKTA